MSHGSAGYFQFPLYLLAFGRDHKEQLQHIVSYCLCEHAQWLNRKLHRPCTDTPLKTAVFEAAKFLHVNVGSYEETIERWNFANWFIEGYEGLYGKDALVRISTSLLWEALSNTGLTYREFSILCAINSIIGDRRSKPMRITEPSIRVRAAGYKSLTVLNRELVRCPPRSAKLLSPHQVRYTVEKLHQRQFFARARVGARTVKYMVEVNDTQLRALLLQTEIYPSRFREERAQKDRELMTMIKSKNQTASHPCPANE